MAEIVSNAYQNAPKSTIRGAVLNWNNKKLWDTALPSALAPYSQDWTKGYDAVASNLHYNNWQSLLSYSNGNFCNQEYYVPLFVNSVQIDLGITGSTAQGRLTRDFYPHNITIPSFEISGECYSTAHYGSLIEYIHMAQHQSLTTNNSKPDIVQFYISGTTNTVPVGRNINGLNITFKSNKSKQTADGPSGNTQPTQKIVGSHGEILCQGYISSIQRTHQAGNHRPTWTAQFLVSQMIKSNIFTEQTGSERETHDWLIMLKSTKSKNWQTKQNQAKNVKTLSSVLSGTSGAISSLSNEV